MLADGGVARQGLLVPVVVDLGEDEAAALAEKSDELAELGLVLEPFGAGAVVVREVPALLGDGDVARLAKDIAADIVREGTSTALAGSAAVDLRHASPATAASARDGG